MTIFELYVVRFWSKQGEPTRHVLYVVWIEIGLYSKNLLTILGSIVNIIGGNLYEKENLRFDNEWDTQS